LSRPRSGWSPSRIRTRILRAIDYDRYAAGEAELGWLNLTATVDSPVDLDGAAFATLVLDRARLAAIGAGTEIAHAKLSLEAPEGALQANLVAAGRETAVQGSLRTRSFKVVVNARVPLDPAELSRVVECALREAAGPAASVAIGVQRAFRPVRPEPTHRMSAAAGV